VIYKVDNPLVSGKPLSVDALNNFALVVQDTMNTVALDHGEHRKPQRFNCPPIETWYINT
jgi:hypothetical protein